MTLHSVRVCRKIGSQTENTTVYQNNRFMVVPRVGDHLRLDVYGKTVEVERVELTPVELHPDIYVKSDYRGYGKGKTKTHDEIVKEYKDKGWQILV